MARIIALNAIFFALPFAVYAGWLILTRGSANNPEYWPLRTVGSLALGGAVLLIAGLLIFIQLSSAPPGATYEPARIGEDGRLVPGTMD